VAIDTAQQLFDAAVEVPLQQATTALLARQGIELLVRRDDLLDPLLSGNKFYKLFFNLQLARAQGFSQILSFGGAYSNHLHALAAAANRYGMASIGVIRGERPSRLSPTLMDAEGWGMKLVFISRAEYGLKTDLNWFAALQACYGRSYVIQEGGANLLGARGMQVLGRALEQQLGGDYSSVCIPVGTGTSLAGLAAGVNGQKPVLGFSVLKGLGDLGGNVAEIYHQLLSSKDKQLKATQNPTLIHAANWKLISGFHGGGYAKKPGAALFDFWKGFERETAVPLDPVYTIKMFWGISSLAQQGYWPRGTRLVAIHTGGLQGRRGFNCP
jgi:1-aminocyclopropane-1-carboxylate deaminase